jgi:hypothetical protein
VQPAASQYTLLRHNSSLSHGRKVNLNRFSRKGAKLAKKDEMPLCKPDFLFSFAAFAALRETLFDLSY